MIDINNILEERKCTHGSFKDHARITQDLKAIINKENSLLTSTQLESLDMILHKIGRIVAGNPNHKDHWDDIAGYAILISKELEENLGEDIMV